MITQVYEEQMAVIALAVDPARKTYGFADVAGAQLGAGMCTVGVHAEVRARCAVMGGKKRAPRFTAANIFVNPRGQGYWPQDSCVFIR
jgi:hypothetical protein